MSAQAAGERKRVVEQNGAAREVGPFGRKLRELRDKYGISQAKLATGADVSPGYIGLIETGIRGDRPSLDVVRRIGKVLGADIDEMEALLKAAGHLGPRESLTREGSPSLRDSISSDPILTQDQKDYMLRGLDLWGYPKADKAPSAGSRAKR